MDATRSVVPSPAASPLTTYSGLLGGAWVWLGVCSALDL